jgi:mono/diheme cytochrome c family protein
MNLSHEGSDMKIRLAALAVPLLVVACATDSYDPLKDYQEVNAVTILDAPTPTGIAPENRALVARGEYLVELLGCGTCHTDGALLGEPVMSRSLAGSGVGIAYTSPLENRNPGVVFAPNITPDRDTGIGRWTDNEIAAAVKTGLGRHGPQAILVMPWQAYSKISDDDTWAIVGYLRSLDPVEHQVPTDVSPGKSTNEDFVYFGVYRTRE